MNNTKSQPVSSDTGQGQAAAGQGQPGGTGGARQGQGGGVGQGQSGGESLTRFKELVTAIIAWAVLAATLWMLIGTFNSAALKDSSNNSTAAAQDEKAQQRQDKLREGSLKLQQDSFNNRKDITLYGLSLLGAIIGYYFGRVPAELHAQAAQRAANNAQQQLNTTQEDLKAANATAVGANATAVAANARADQVTKQTEQLKSDLKSTLAALKDRIARVSAQTETLRAGTPAPTSPDLAQAERDISALLTRL